MASRKGNQRGKVTWAQAFRDTVIAAMNRGQLPFYCIFLIVLVIVLRLSPSDLSKLAENFLNLLVSWKIAGWVLFSLLLFAWYIQARFMRKKFSGEFERVGREKSHLQSQMAGERFDSSGE